MSNDTPVVFIGSGEASVLERKTLIYSIRKNTPTPVEIIVFNGTHNTIEREGHPPELTSMSLRAKYLNTTEFSNYRYLIPELRGHAGRAIYIDSDMICLHDLNDLFSMPMHDQDLMALAFTDQRGVPKWGLSVALYDCTRCHFDLDGYVDEIGQGRFTYNDMHQFSPTFLGVHPFKVGAIDPQWNCYDEYTPATKLIHYTNLHTQPWKTRGHPHGALWFDYFDQARAAGYVTEADIDLAIRRGYARQDLRSGNTISVRSVARNALSDLKAAVRDVSRA